MSGKKHYRMSGTARSRVNEMASAQIAELSAQLEAQRKLLEEQQRRQLAEQEAERQRLAESARAKAMREEQARRRQLADEIRAIVAECEIELSAADVFFDSRFSTASIKDALKSVQQIAESAREASTVRESSRRFKNVLNDYTTNIAIFKREAANVEQVIRSAEESQSVRSFLRRELDSLLCSYRELFTEESLVKTGFQGAIEALRQFEKTATDLLSRAIHTAAEYQSRNKLLEATIAALKGMGFYVSDPAFADPRKPAGPVVILANRAGERIVINVPLQGEVESDWQGSLEGHCVSDFTTFLSRLAEFGCPCEASVPAKTASPELLAQNAKSLPQGKSKDRGV